ncbi:MAG: hypothetical protein HN353_05075 [Bdellovibrionales bacterium]|nr:hypothetical protein [Bdellovibrionales bacterium]
MKSILICDRFSLTLFLRQFLFLVLIISLTACVEEQAPGNSGSQDDLQVVSQAVSTSDAQPIDSLISQPTAVSAPQVIESNSQDSGGGFLGNLLSPITSLFGGGGGLGGMLGGLFGGGNPLSGILGNLTGGGSASSGGIGGIFGNLFGGSNPLSGIMGNLTGGGSANSGGIGGIFGNLFGGSNPLSGIMGNLTGGGSASSGGIGGIFGNLFGGSNPLSGIMGNLTGGGSANSGGIGGIFGNLFGGSNPLSGILGNLTGGGSGGIGSIFGNLFGGNSSNPLGGLLGNVMGGVNNNSATTMPNFGSLFPQGDLLGSLLGGAAPAGSLITFPGTDQGEAQVVDQYAQEAFRPLSAQGESQILVASDLLDGQGDGLNATEIIAHRNSHALLAISGGFSGDFGMVTDGSAAMEVLRISNVGAVDASSIQLIPDQSQYSIISTSCQSALAAGEFCEMLIRLDTNGEHQLQGAVELDYNNGVELDTFRVELKGVSEDYIAI